ncbi:hypothetical protein MLD38_034176 [Melastoma candidum]|uniref:Uncharacterized protein n=1 Tax=Melastoma candidum TaxID=119954 RepID=A0ACB9M943_9MYRT|nr:hypothetical protein MLD38_034176 [Melastoma candidum]
MFSGDSRSEERATDENSLRSVVVMGMLENRRGKEGVVSNLHGEPSGTGRNKQDENQCNGGSSGTNQKDLEAMLRQRALLNLQKLRGFEKSEMSHASQEPNVAAAQEEPELPREDQEKAVFATLGTVSAGKQPESSSVGLVKRNVASVSRQPILSAVAPALSNPWRTSYTWRRESTLSQPPAKQLISPLKPIPPQQEPGRTEISTTTVAPETTLKPSVLNQLPRKELSLPQKPKSHLTKSNATETTNSVSFAESSCIELASSAMPVEELSLPEMPKPPSQAKPAVIRMEATANAVEDGQNGSAAADETSLNELPQQGSPDGKQSTEITAKPGAVNSEKVVDAAAGKEGPRYEQKTMSITKGGETIQVNYQVYIPKRAPALARRQLKRDS